TTGIKPESFTPSFLARVMRVLNAKPVFRTAHRVLGFPINSNQPMLF
ncbi:unnamed protein product, partial [marine sediment metagenome]